MNGFELLAPSRVPLCDRVNSHDLIRVAVDGDTGSDYAMLVPKGWVCATKFGAKARFDGTPEPIGAFVTLPCPTTPGLLVTKTLVGTHVFARDLLCHRIVEEGATILGETVAEGPHGPRLQIASRTRDGGMLRVSTAHVDGGRMFVVDAVAKERLFPQLHETFSPCGVSFALVRPTGIQRLGRTRVVTSGRLSVELPSDWNARGIADAHAIESSVHEPATSRALVRLRSSTVGVSADALAERWRTSSGMAGRCARPGHACVDAPRAVGAAFRAACIELRGCGRDGTLVLTAACRRLGDHVLDIGILAPALHVDLSAWLRARGVLELALETGTVLDR